MAVSNMLGTKQLMQQLSRLSPTASSKPGRDNEYVITTSLLCALLLLSASTVTYMPLNHLRRFSDGNKV